MFTRYIRPGAQTLENARFPEVDILPISYEVQGANAAPINRRAVVNIDSGQHYSFVSPGYELIRHEDLIDHVFSSIPGDWGRQNNELWLSPDSAKMSLRVRFPDAIDEVGTGDFVAPSLHVFNSYDTSWPAVVVFGAFRLVCSNGAVVGRRFGSYRKKHLGEFDAQELRGHLDNAIDLFQDELGIWRQWQDIAATPDDYESMVGSLGFGQRAESRLGDLVEIDSNLTIEDMRLRTLSKWNLFNLVTQFISHEVQSENRRIQLETRLRDAI